MYKSFLISTTILATILGTDVFATRNPQDHGLTRPSRTQQPRELGSMLEEGSTTSAESLNRRFQTRLDTQAWENLTTRLEDAVKGTPFEETYTLYTCPISSILIQIPVRLEQDNSELLSTQIFDLDSIQKYFETHASERWYSDPPFPNNPMNRIPLTGRLLFQPRIYDEINQMINHRDLNSQNQAVSQRPSVTDQLLPVQQRQVQLTREAVERESQAQIRQREAEEEAEIEALGSSFYSQFADAYAYTHSIASGLAYPFFDDDEYSTSSEDESPTQTLTNNFPQTHQAGPSRPAAGPSRQYQGIYLPDGCTFDANPHTLTIVKSDRRSYIFTRGNFAVSNGNILLKVTRNNTVINDVSIDTFKNNKLMTSR